MVTRGLNSKGGSHTSVMLFLCALCLLMSSPPVSLAEIGTTITSSALLSCPGPCGAGVTIVSPPLLGSTVTTITGGARPGDGPNLFHSFGRFDVGTGDIANFLNDTHLPTSNILSRVTGGNPSQIYGTIQTTDFPGADLFLINPSGIVFGPQGSFDVSGSVSFSTAQYFRLFDGVNSANFYANPANDGLANSVFAIAPVDAFGFLPAAYGFLTTPDLSATITVQGSALSVSAGLPDSPGHSISFVGGNVIIEDGARLSAPNGTIQLASAVSPGEFDVATLGSLPNGDGASFSSIGSVSLAPDSSIDVSGANTVFIKGGQLVLSVNDALLSTLTTSQTPGLPETISLSPGSSIVTSNSGTDPGADVQLITSSVQMEGASITTRTSGPGRGGDIIVTAGTLQLNGESKIFTETDSVSRGGDLQLNVNTLALAEGATLRTSNNDLSGTTDENGNVTLGVGGDIIIQGVSGPGSEATDVTITGRGSSDSPSEIKSESSAGLFAFGPTLAGGKGGSVTIASQSITLNNDGKITSETNVIGPGGEIDLGLRQLTISNGGQINSSTGSFDPGSPGGKITIHELAEGLAPSVALLGSGINGFSGVSSFSSGNANPGDISITTGTLSLTDGALIRSGNPDIPQGARITIHASDSVQVTTGSAISSKASFQPAGALIITTPMLRMNQGLIDTSTIGTGKAGDVTLNVRALTLENGSRVESGTTGSGSAGSITVQGFEGTAGSRADSVTIGGHDFIGQPSGLFTETGKVGNNENIAAEGAGGNIKVVTNTFTLEDVGRISAASSSISPLAIGGSITVDANRATVRTGAFITAESIRTTGEGGAAPGGDVEITAQALTLDHGAISAATAGSGEGGSITVNTTGGAVSLANGSRISSASTGTTAVTNPDGTTQAPGAAGNVVITAAASFTSDASTVATSAEANRSGDISITAQTVQLSGGTSITASSKAPLKVTEFILDNDGTLVGQEVGKGDAGNITIHSASTFVIEDNSKVTTEASQASGGQVVITAPDRVQLINSRISTSVKGVAGVSDGGNINIDPQFVILQNTQIRANAVAGAGGAITITATSAYIADPFSIVDASSTLGINGPINILSPIQNVGGELAALSQEFSSAAALLAQQCAARAADGKFSTFVVAAREGLPMEPGGFLASPSLTAEVLGSRLSGRERHSPIAAVTNQFPKDDAKPIQLAKLGNACR